MPYFSVLTLSDSCSRGTREDGSGPAIIRLMEEAGYTRVDYRTTEDGVEPVSQFIREMCTTDVDLLLTPGGTGFSPCDFTPEATDQACSRKVPGIPEMLRYRSSKKGEICMAQPGNCRNQGKHPCCKPSRQCESCYRVCRVSSSSASTCS